MSTNYRALCDNMVLVASQMGYVSFGLPTDKDATLIANELNALRVGSGLLITNIASTRLIIDAILELPNWSKNILILVTPQIYNLDLTAVKESLSDKAPTTKIIHLYNLM